MSGVLVTGASSGIGREVVRLLHRRGVRVAGVARDAARLAALALELPGFVPIVGDVTAEGFPSRAVSEADEVLGGLDGLVNAAGILEAGTLETTSDADFDRTLTVNLRAVFSLSREAVPFLRRQAPRAAIVNVSSVGGLRPFPGVLAYCVSKAALDQLTRCMAIEVAPSGVRVNAVNPGVIVTELHRRGGMSEESYAAFLERGKQTHPLGRVGTAEEVAVTIAYLLSEEAAFITGETLAIDGGRHLTAAR